jgi:hypothetical protein
MHFARFAGRRTPMQCCWQSIGVARADVPESVVITINAVAATWDHRDMRRA